MSSHGLMPKGPPQAGGVATRNIPTPSAPTLGHRKFLLRLSREDLRQASKGPTAVRNKRINANGTVTLLKKGGPTVILCPCTHSESIGNRVPHRATKKISRNKTLLNKKLDSREISDSNRCSVRK